MGNLMRHIINIPVSIFIRLVSFANLVRQLRSQRRHRSSTQIGDQVLAKVAAVDGGSDAGVDACLESVLFQLLGEVGDELVHAGGSFGSTGSDEFLHERRIRNAFHQPRREHGRSQDAHGVDGGERLERRADVAAVADHLHARLDDQGIETGGNRCGHNAFFGQPEYARGESLAARRQRQRQSHGQGHELHARAADAGVGLVPLVVDFLDGLPVDVVAFQQVAHPGKARSLGELGYVFLKIPGFAVLNLHALGGGDGQAMSKSKGKARLGRAFNHAGDKSIRA